MRLLILLPLIIITFFSTCKVFLSFSVRFGKVFLLKEKYAKIKKNDFRFLLQWSFLAVTGRSHFVSVSSSTNRIVVVWLAGCSLLDTDHSQKNVADKSLPKDLARWCDILGGGSALGMLRILGNMLWMGSYELLPRNLLSIIHFFCQNNAPYKA